MDGHGANQSNLLANNMRDYPPESARAVCRSRLCNPAAALDLQDQSEQLVRYSHTDTGSNPPHRTPGGQLITPTSLQANFRRNSDAFRDLPTPLADEIAVLAILRQRRVCD